MIIFWFIALLLVFSSDDATAAAVPFNLDFELTDTDGPVPLNWKCDSETLSIASDSSESYEGEWSARLWCIQTAAVAGRLEQIIPFNGDAAGLSGFARIEDFQEETSAGLFMSTLDSSGNIVQTETISFENFHPDSQWGFFSVSLQSTGPSDSLIFGAYLSGSGTLWVDELELTLDGGQPAEPSISAETELAPYYGFDYGSGIENLNLTSFQIESLVQTGRVWGFLKYHHPTICRGELNWDYELFRAMPGVLDASTPEERETALLGLFENLGSVESGDYTLLDSDTVRISVNLDWIEDSNLGAELSMALQTVYDGRYQGNSAYAVISPDPAFIENSYSDMVFPDTGFRLLALFRYWAAIEYFFPYRYATDTNWSSQLRNSLPLFVSAESTLEYQLAIQRLMVAVGDTNAGILIETQPLKYFYGEYNIPVHLCSIDGRWVVDGYTNIAGEESLIKVGDVILMCDGVQVEDRVEQLTPFTGGSTTWSAQDVMGTNLLRGRSASADLRISRGGQIFDLTVARVPSEETNLSYSEKPSLGDQSFAVTANGLGYVHIASLNPSEIDGMKAAFRDARGIVFDLRGNPSVSVLYEVADFILPEETVFAVLTSCDSDNPGVFYWAETCTAGGGAPDNYTGRVALLVDQGSRGSAEFHAMAWKLAPEARVFGHATSGAFGESIPLEMPGGVKTALTCQGVYYPDHSEIQRAGVLPDVEISPTVAGLQAGRDEVLEAAVDWILSD